MCVSKNIHTYEEDTYVNDKIPHELTILPAQIQDYKILNLISSLTSAFLFSTLRISVLKNIGNKGFRIFYNYSVTLPFIIHTIVSEL